MRKATGTSPSATVSGGTQSRQCIEVGFGGVWVGAAPYLMYIPIDASGEPTAGEPQILLDGFSGTTTRTKHSIPFRGDLMAGCIRMSWVFTQSYVGKPGTPRLERVHINAGVFRYHPTKHILRAIL